MGITEVMPKLVFCRFVHFGAGAALQLEPSQVFAAQIVQERKMLVDYRQHQVGRIDKWLALAGLQVVLLNGF